MELYWIWTIVIAVTLLIEFFTFQMVGIWLSVGGVFALILSFIPGIGLEVQLVVFAGVALLAIVFLRPFAVKFLQSKKQDINSIAGKIVVVEEDISPEHSGLVKLNGALWTAISSQTIKKGENAIAIEIVGNKIKVKKGENL